MTLPATDTLLLREDGPFLHITLNRPESRNAMSLTMVNELMAVFDAIAADDHCRAVILRGSQGHFCAGGDIKDMAGARMKAAAGDNDAYFQLNRRFGEMITRANKLPQVLITVIEGAVLGGGFGLACVSDIAICQQDAKFGLPETTLGILPAQIAPFVVKRIGLTQTRRLALTAARFNGSEAERLGLVHFSETDSEAVDARLHQVLSQVRQCAPQANAQTKALLLASEHEALGPLLDRAAEQFAAAVTGSEGVEGTMAFVQKRAPKWAH